MNSLPWNDGMSVGVDAIDNDHKKILSIIARIVDAIDNSSTDEIIEDIFHDLEYYVSSHFKREEELLEMIAYPDLQKHKNSHQRFIKKIPKLKDELIRHDSFDVAEKVSFFLHDWFINHILNEDMDYTHSIHNYQKKQEKNTDSLFVRASNWLGKYITLTQRIFITSVLPVMGIIALSYMILNDNYQQYKNMKLLSGLNQIIFQINELTHNLQAERGLSSGFALGNSKQFSSELIAQRKMSDSAIDEFMMVLDEHSDLISRQNFLYAIKQLKNELADLTEHRRNIDHQSSDYEKLEAFYTQIIEHLLTIESHLIQIDMDSELANTLMAITALLNLKEAAGQERAIGTTLIEMDKANPERFRHYNLVQGRQFNALKIFNYSANEEQKAICGSLCEPSEQHLNDARIFVNLMSGHTMSISGKQWFDYISERMDKLKVVADNLINELNHQTDKQLNYLLSRFYLVMAIIAVIIILNTLLLLVLNHSIITSIQRITIALKNITSGYKELQIYDQYARDEIGAMSRAYETLRRKLLQADIAQELIKGQKRSLQYRKSEQKHYQALASTDTLTGALNRRRFDELIIEEIDKTYKDNNDLSVLLLDIDFFKNINDTYGHGVGDRVLQSFYRLCHKTVRFSDMVARIGGEEFVILMPQTNQEQAVRFAERIRKTVDEYIMIIDEYSIHLTVSIGVSQWDPQVFKHADEWLECADKALYTAKNSGRNQVISQSDINKTA